MNKHQKALDSIKKLIDPDLLFVTYYETVPNEDIKLLQELVDKETPAKPLTDNSGYFPHCNKVRYICPNCGQIMLREICTKKHKPAYCYKCGKKLDWGEEI